MSCDDKIEYWNNLVIFNAFDLDRSKNSNIQLFKSFKYNSNINKNYNDTSELNLTLKASNSVSFPSEVFFISFKHYELQKLCYLFDKFYSEKDKMVDINFNFPHILRENNNKTKILKISLIYKDSDSYTNSNKKYIVAKFTFCDTQKSNFSIYLNWQDFRNFICIINQYINNNLLYHSVLHSGMLVSIKLDTLYNEIVNIKNKMCFDDIFTKLDSLSLTKSVSDNKYENSCMMSDIKSYPDNFDDTIVNVENFSLQNDFLDKIKTDTENFVGENIDLDISTVNEKNMDNIKENHSSRALNYLFIYDIMGNKYEGLTIIRNFVEQISEGSNLSSFNLYRYILEICNVPENEISKLESINDYFVIQYIIIKLVKSYVNAVLNNKMTDFDVSIFDRVRLPFYITKDMALYKFCISMFSLFLIFKIFEISLGNWTNNIPESYSNKFFIYDFIMNMNFIKICFSILLNSISDDDIIEFFDSVKTCILDIIHFGMFDKINSIAKDINVKEVVFTSDMIDSFIYKIMDVFNNNTFYVFDINNINNKIINNEDVKCIKSVENIKEKLFTTNENNKSDEQSSRKNILIECIREKSNDKNTKIFFEEWEKYDFSDDYIRDNIKNFSLDIMIYKFFRVYFVNNDFSSKNEFMTLVNNWVEEEEVLVERIKNIGHNNKSLDTNEAVIESILELP